MSSKPHKINVMKAEAKVRIQTVKALTREVINQNPLVFERLARI